MDRKNSYLPAYVLFLCFYLFIAVLSITKGSNWIIDGILSSAVITVVYLMRNKWRISLIPFIFINIALVMHNAGLFGAYSIDWKIFQYDNLLHFFSCAVVAYVAFNFLAKSFRIKKVHAALLAITIVMTLGFFIELTEYTGYLTLGKGDGLLLTGIGDYDGASCMAAYLDTMDDQLSNLIGAVAGTIIFYFINKKKGIRT